MGMYGGDAQGRQFAINIGEQRRREAQRDRNWNREMDVQQSRYEDQSARDQQRMGLQKSALDINQRNSDRSQQEYDYQVRQRDLANKLKPWGEQGFGYIVEGVMSGKPKEKILEDFNSVGKTQDFDNAYFDEETGSVVIEKKGKKKVFTQEELPVLMGLHQQVIDRDIGREGKKAQLEAIKGKPKNQEIVKLEKQMEKDDRELRGWNAKLINKKTEEEDPTVRKNIDTLQIRIRYAQEKINELNGTPTDTKTAKSNKEDPFSMYQD